MEVTEETACFEEGAKADALKTLEMRRIRENTVFIVAVHVDVEVEMSFFQLLVILFTHQLLHTRLASNCSIIRSDDVVDVVEQERYIGIGSSSTDGGKGCHFILPIPFRVIYGSGG